MFSRKYAICSDFEKSLSIKSSDFEETYCGSELPNNLSLTGIVEVRFVSDGSMGTFCRFLLMFTFLKTLATLPSVYIIYYIIYIQ